MILYAHKVPHVPISFRELNWNQFALVVENTLL